MAGRPAKWLSLGESGKNFIETGKTANRQQTILIKMTRLGLPVARRKETEKQCRNAKSEKATWNYPQSVWAAWE
jgi:hypothetical protein